MLINSIVRVFRPLMYLRLQYYLLRLRIIFKPRIVKQVEVQKWLESLAPIGLNPLEATTTYHTWASE